MSWETDAIKSLQEPSPLYSWEGKIEKCSNEVYHERKELSSSDIKHMLASPAHFKRLSLEKHLLEERVSSEAFDLGTCAHECFLEQDTRAFVVAPDVDRRTKIGKTAYEAFAADHAEHRIISSEQHQRLMRMFDVISSNPLACSYLDGSLVEESYLYLDEPTGLRCKFRPDILNLTQAQGYIADYKTAQSASPHEFAKAAARYNYGLSASHYIQGVKRLFGVSILDYYFIVQEKQEPYAVAIYRMSQSDIERSHAQRALIMQKIADCSARDSWPDFSERVLPLSIPGYAFNFQGDQ